ncbi:hypothetical protein B0H14DRAFT_2332061, partial [Mycena olivaceomarginata]
TALVMDTSPTGTFPTASLPALRQRSPLCTDTRYPFGSLVALWSRQASVTCTLVAVR